MPTHQLFFWFSFFYSKFISLTLHPVVGMSSSILHLLVNRNFFRNLECTVLIVLLDPVSVSFKSPLFRQYILTFLLKLYYKICKLFLFLTVHPNIFQCFSPLLCIFACCRTFFSCAIIIILFIWEFFTPVLADGLHWSLSDNKSPQVSGTLLSILADLNNAVVWMISTRLLISKSSNPNDNPSVTVPSAAITIGITVTFMFHSFFFFFQFSNKV